MWKRGPLFYLIAYAAVSKVACAGFVVAPIEWSVSAGGNGHYYGLFESGPIAWTDARDAAAALELLGSPGHLATITDGAESAFLQSTYASFIGDPNGAGGIFPFVAGVRAWIGLTDVANEGVFQWITAETFAYSEWAGPEPNDLGNEDYVFVWRRDFGSGPQWSWNDASNAAGPATAYFVEFAGPFQPVPEPNSIVLIIVGSTIAGACRNRWTRNREEGK